jgi:hypothetical protein
VELRLNIPPNVPLAGADYDVGYIQITESFYSNLTEALLCKFTYQLQYKIYLQVGNVNSDRDNSPIYLS